MRATDLAQEIRELRKVAENINDTFPKMFEVGIKQIVESNRQTEATINTFIGLIMHCVPDCPKRDKK